MGTREATVHIVNDNQRPGSLDKARHETLRRWVEELLASDHLDSATADDIRDAVAKKLPLRARVGRRQTAEI
jgi:hypothetical protein